ncbi:MAG: Geranylgeranyl pyrophosphate synthase [Chloroflexi bacterium AL-W]|nr:Geranylgeranyl pyrophosphate synthase [Chloroflexi bacterium AL-N1]NOK67588.1 Geranylgeranyl pyrophosphate synthase [Chloroflexi bacterium AL-N10]NOK75642.1 Geranylgeranyl pyrophosphate synthase [Chloroflexi bacterium AL-N5]NOK82430.1 Geranylgeranyl pyrophosphate synthase [Chloroflexi bacterium AL-W]NOK90275.1 Geranylgeranyl pyrophosphate synthase [Chloroflexi bacterium AL-N15]
MALTAVRRGFSTKEGPVFASAPVDLNHIFRQTNLHDDLAYVEHRLMQRVESRSPVLSSAGAYITAAGGKRLRAALVLLAARLGNYNLHHASHPAAAIELLHSASLIHDDLVDHTQRRRGRVTVHARWNNTVALVLGDYLFAAATDELANEPDPRLIEWYAAAAQTVVEGELSPVTQLEPLDIALAQYRYKIGCKTAALFKVACQAGMAVAGGTPEEIERLAEFGYHLGMAFQIVDDVLDFTGDEDTLGKPAGNDLREGTLTLPLIYAVMQDDHALLRQVAHTASLDPSQVPELVSAVIDAGGAERALEEARITIEHALACLDRFPSSTTKQALSDIGAFVLARQA